MNDASASRKISELTFLLRAFVGLMALQVVPLAVFVWIVQDQAKGVALGFLGIWCVAFLGASGWLVYRLVEATGEKKAWLVIALNFVPFGAILSVYFFREFVLKAGSALGAHIRIFPPMPERFSQLLGAA